MENRKYDFIVVGGGVAGVSCAYIGAKLGQKVLLVEKNNYLGGMAVGALVAPVMKATTKKINTEFFDDLILFAKKYNAQITYGDGNDGWLNPVLLKVVLEDMLTSSGVDILYEARPIDYKLSEDEKNIVSIEIENKILSLPYEAKYYVDTTGDAEFSKLLNCEFWSDVDINQPSSLRFILSNVNIEAFRDFIMEFDPDRNVTTSYTIDGQIHLSTACTWDTDKHWALTPFFKDAVETGILKSSDTDYFQLFTVAGANGSVTFNCPRIKQDSPKEQMSLSKGLIEARQAIVRLTNFCRKYLKGFEHAAITNIADMTGVREFKRVKCKYDYTIEDMQSEKQFENNVLTSDYPVDIHSNEKDGSTLRVMRSYYLPVESLMSKNYDNLYVAGRCLGADFKAQAALRVQSSCMSMGEGVARDICCKQKT